LVRLDGQPGSRRQALTLLGLFGLTLAIVFAIYYRHYIGLIGEILQRITAARSEQPAEALGWQGGLGAEWRRTEQALGWLALPLALAGLPGLWRPASLTGRLIAGWLAAAALFGLIGLLLGLTVRYHFFALLGLAVTGGWALAWLGRHGWPGRLAAGLLATGWLVGSLLFWYDRIINYLH
jgi:hypothetical protein